MARTSLICAGTIGEEGKPLRQVHLKVLRNWQVNCAMHAWATALWGALHAGPGRYSSLLLGTCTPILSPPFFFLLDVNLAAAHHST